MRAEDLFYFLRKIPQYPEILRRSRAGFNRHRNSGLNRKVSEALLSWGRNTQGFNLEETGLLVESLLPWRTGPFTINDLKIDSEWRSEIKWEQIRPHLPPLKNAKILDVGAGNGYFSFKLLEKDPHSILAVDPVDRCWLQFKVLQGALNEPRVSFLPLGIGELDLFDSTFDFALCMGVIYHQREPVEALKKLRQALRPGGSCLLESLSIPGDYLEPLIPTERYAKMRNAWVIPTVTVMANWLCHAGFRDVKIAGVYPITVEEQRRTKFAPYESLAEFLDPNDRSKTIEGYPAPQKGIVVGWR